MGSLTSCMKKAGEYLHPDDKAAIMARAAELRKSGLKAQQAAIQAVDEQLQAIEKLLPAKPKKVVPEVKSPAEDAAPSEQFRNTGRLSMFPDQDISFARRIGGQDQSRAGIVIEHERYKQGEKAGQYKGAPEKYNTPAKIGKLRDLLSLLTMEGLNGAHWYENSGMVALKVTAGNVEEARKLVGLFALYSPQAKVDANTTFAMRAWAQHKAGKGVQVKTAAQDQKAQDWLDGKIGPDGLGSEKVTNFFNNLMRQVNAQAHHAAVQGVTVDLWMMRAAGYETESPNDAQYRFVEIETNRIAQLTGFEPQQVQAAIWVAMKARAENKGVKDRTIERSIARRYSRYVTVEKNGKDVRTLVVTDRLRHYRTWISEALAYEPTDSDLKVAAFDYSDGLSRHVGQVSWEARPGRTTGVLPGVNDAPYAQQVEFQNAVKAALLDEDGNDPLAQKLGILRFDSVDAPGVWQGEVSAGTQEQMVVAPGLAGDGIDEGQQKLLNVYAATMGWLLRQEGVGYHKPKFRTAIRDANAVDINIGRTLSEREMRVLYEGVRKASADRIQSFDNDIGFISTPEGVRVVQFIFPGEDLSTTDWHNGNKRLHLDVDAALQAIEFDGGESVMARPFASDGALISNNWKEQPNGEGYVARIAQEGRSDVLRWAADVLGPRVQAVFDGYAERNGWGDAGRIPSISFRRSDEPVPGEQSAPVYGQARDGAVQVTGWHFSTQPRAALTSAAFGSGLRGSSREQFLNAVDQRSRQRVYFYVDKGNGIHPESGVGGAAHEVSLANVYDSDADALKLKRGSNWQAFETALMDAGFDGYLYREHNLSGAVVLIGQHNVPVAYRGNGKDATRPGGGVQAQTQSAPASRQEGEDIVRRPQGAELSQIIRNRSSIEQAAPSFRLQYGEARVNAAERAAANAVLEGAGSSFSFSRGALELAQELNTYQGSRQSMEGYPQPKGTPVSELFSNFADQFKSKEEPKYWRDNTGQGRTYEQARNDWLEQFRTSMFDRANNFIGSWAKDVVTSEVPFMENANAVITASKIAGTARVQIVSKKGVVVAAARLDKGKLDAIGVIDKARGFELGSELLVWLKENNLANIAEVPDRSPGFVKAQKKAFEKLGSDVSFARNALKQDSVADVLQMTQTGRLSYDLGDAIERSNWAEAYQLAKSPAERKTLLRQLGDTVIETFADSKIKLSRWIQGLPLSENTRQSLEGNLRRADTVRSRMEKDVKLQFAEPMFKAITAAAKATKLSTDQVKKLAGYWMTARYAQEANAWLIQKDRVELQRAIATGDANLIAAAQQNLNDRIADVNAAAGAPRTRGVGGGMNNAEAMQIVLNVEGKIDIALLEAIADPVYDMMAWKKAEDIRSGKVSQSMVNSWPNSRYYVPLTGDPRADRESMDVFSAGNQINQDADKAMNGRKDSVADDAIDASFAAVVKSVNFAAIQDFKRSLNTAYEQAQLQGHDIGLTREPVTGIMRTGDNVIIYRDSRTAANGLQTTQTHAFKFRDERIMEALKRDNMESLSKMLAVVQTPTRWYARAVTQFMPFFAPINFVRDIWERSELIRTRKLYDANGNLIDTKQAARDSIAESINRDVWRATIGKAFKMGGMTQVRGDLEEMVRLGGASTWGDYLDKTASDLESSIRLDGSKLGHLANKSMGLVESWNESFEMVPTLAIYRSLKKQGMTPQDAAAAVLDLMNFRKKGTVMPSVRALYVFAQPAATSGYNLMQYLSTPVGRKRFAAQAIIATALYALLKNVWGDDEDEELGNKLDNLSNFTVERSIPVKLGDYVLKVPVGFGPPQLAWSLGGILNRWESGRYSTGDALGELAKGWAKAMAPIAPSDMEISKRPVDFFVQTFTPTILKPIFNIYANQTNFGAPLTPAIPNQDKLKAEQARRSTAGAYSDAAMWLYETTGVDVFPDHIKALSDGYLVGPLREIINLTIEWDAKAQRGEPGRLPLVGSLVDTINDRQILNSVYGRVRNDMDKQHREFMHMNGDPEKRGDITAEQRMQERAFQRFSSMEKVLGAQRSALRKQNLDEDVMAERMTALELRADEAHRRLLREYFEAQNR